ncbi:hypothetical protein BDW75DRAFT_200205 [Aspergillus navahoensis]
MKIDYYLQPISSGGAVGRQEAFPGPSHSFPFRIGLGLASSISTSICMILVPFYADDSVRQIISVIWPALSHRSLGTDAASSGSG